MSNQSSTLVGAVVAVLIIAAVATLGYYQVAVAPNLTTSSSTSATQAACTRSTCAFVNITSGAGSCITASSPCGFGSAPYSITVVMGVNNTVVWTNTDSGIHTVTGDTLTSLSSGNLHQGDTYQYTFSAAGTYQYHCIYHAGMIATVVVKA